MMHPFYPKRLLSALALILLLGNGLQGQDKENSATPDTAESIPKIDVPPGHPLGPVMDYAHKALTKLTTVKDYTCILIKRERVEGKLLPYQYIGTKIRHPQMIDGAPRPFSVYLFYHRPTTVRGREVLYMKGQNGNQMLARRGGSRLASVTTWVKPTSRLVMQENRYPITEIGIRNLVKKLIDVAQEDLKHQECEVQYFKDAKLSGRACTRIQVVHPVKRPHFRYHKANIYVDNELQIPIRFASFDWPKATGENPLLLEEYNYMQLKLNAGLSDMDFDRNNASYGFRKDKQPETETAKQPDKEDVAKDAAQEAAQ